MNPTHLTTIDERWQIRLPEHRARFFADHPAWELERLLAMSESISEGSVVYDVGAEEGDLPALWASWGADVVMVEPDPRVWPNIRTIFEANDLTKRVRACFAGFAGETERIEDAWLHEYGGSDVWPRCANGEVIEDHGFLVLPERPDVAVTTVDALAEEYGPPTHITIDVEGAELTVLRGAVSVLQRNRPVVFVSVHIDMPWIDEKYPGDTGEKLDKFMRAVGYEGTHLATDHEEHWRYEPV